MTAALLFAGNAGWAADISVRVKQTFAKPNTVTLPLREVRAKSDHANENVTGLTRTRFSTQMSSQFRLEQSGGLWCVTSATAEIQVGYDQIVIYIPREFAADSCQHKAVLKHEERHVETAREVLRQIAPEVSRIVSGAYRQGRSRYCGASQERARDAAMAALEAGMSRIKERANDLSARLQGAVDTPEEYRRVSASCPSWPPH
jgi:hypothetical protein